MLVSFIKEIAPTNLWKMNPCLLVQIFPKGCGKTSYKKSFKWPFFFAWIGDVSVEEMGDFQSPMKKCVSSYCNTLNGSEIPQKAVDMENLKKMRMWFYISQVVSHIFLRWRERALGGEVMGT